MRTSSITRASIGFGFLVLFAACGSPSDDLNDTPKASGSSGSSNSGGSGDGSGGDGTSGMTSGGSGSGAAGGKGGSANASGGAGGAGASGGTGGSGGNGGSNANDGGTNASGGDATAGSAGTGNAPACEDAQSCADAALGEGCITDEKACVCGADSNWHCFTTDIECPETKPDADSACVYDDFQAACAYEVATFCRCRSSTNQWSCTGESDNSANCPAEPPADASECDSQSRTCNYESVACACDDNIWYCPTKG